MQNFHTFSPTGYIWGSLSLKLPWPACRGALWFCQIEFDKQHGNKLWSRQSRSNRFTACNESRLAPLYLTHRARPCLFSWFSPINEQFVLPFFLLLRLTRTVSHGLEKATPDAGGPKLIYCLQSYLHSAAGVAVGEMIRVSNEYKACETRY